MPYKTILCNLSLEDGKRIANYCKQFNTFDTRKKVVCIFVEYV
jgi:hypothetical protein